MISKTKEGLTIVELGEGTLFSGVAHDSMDNPVGIFFTNTSDSKNVDYKETVLIQLTSEKAIASYLSALTRYFKALNKGQNEELERAVEEFENILSAKDLIINPKSKGG